VSKRRHHFVPKLYLKAFRSAPKMIHIHNLAHHKTIRAASLRDQCYAHKLYGDTDDVEDVLSVFESHTAPVFQKIIEREILPPARSEEHLLLIFFVALQLTRTPLVAGRFNAISEKLVEHIAHEYPGATEADLEDFRFGSDNPTLVSLSNAADIAYAISDLKSHLVCASKDQTFITSDNPTCKYNQYYEGLQGMGITGPLWRGLQVYLPLSPKHLLLLFDNSVYKVGKKGSDVTSAVSNGDLDTINLLQVVNADQNLYFNDWNIRHEVKRWSQEGLRYRDDDPTIVEDFVQVGQEETSSLIHVFERMPNVKLRLSFVRLRKRAKNLAKSKWKHRLYRYRKTFPGEGSDIADNVPHEIRTEVYRRR
jgi:hypothetical protein